MQESSAWEELTSFIEELKNDLSKNIDVDKPNQSHFTIAQIKTMEKMQNLPILFAEKLKREVEIEKSRLEYERIKPN
jgi:hypothetical protein